MEFLSDNWTLIVWLLGVLAPFIFSYLQARQTALTRRKGSIILFWSLLWWTLILGFLSGSWKPFVWFSGTALFFSLTVRREDSRWTAVWIGVFWLGVFGGLLSLLRWGPSKTVGFLFSFWTLILLFVGTVIFLWLTARRTDPRRTNPLRAAVLWVILKIQWISFRLLARLGPVVDRWIVPWHRVPRYLGLPVLVGIRDKLREKNLFNTTSSEDREEQLEPPSTRDFTTRTLDGAFNDLEKPQMGKAGTPFGRNVCLKTLFYEDLPGDPNPRAVSLKLMTRNKGKFKPAKFEPATSLNLLAAAWIQFMVHDWFLHENEESSERPEHLIDIPLLQKDDSWPFKGFRLRVPKTKPPNSEEELLIRKPAEKDGPRADGPPIFINHGTHWWDASQLYGSDETKQRLLRLGQRHGKLRICRILNEDTMLPLDEETGLDLAGFDKNWWLGLNLMHTLFTLEHNAICDRLHEEYPSWPDDDLFARARLINAALMAKIHTVEWTPSILDHPTLRAGMRGNWWGILGRKLRRNFGRLLGPEDEVFSGIPGSATEHHNVPYAMTEEFVSVYRMHPLMPDCFFFRSAIDHKLLLTRSLLRVRDAHVRQIRRKISTPEGKSFQELAVKDHVRQIRKKIPMTDLLYSFGIAHPGALTLGNYPYFLQNLLIQDPHTKEELRLDLAAVDILRDRERGVLRYNAFRQALGLRRVKSFNELTARFEKKEERDYWEKNLEKVYGKERGKDAVDRVDLMVGLFAEKPPRGFGFSDTAFRIFILMASRRLKSDRFFTTDYRPEIYTQIGLDWIENNDMSTVLLRHFPALRPFLSRVDSAFKPWPTVKQLSGTPI